MAADALAPNCSFNYHKNSASKKTRPYTTSAHDNIIVKPNVKHAGNILWMGPANERRSYIVTSSLIG